MDNEHTQETAAANDQRMADLSAFADGLVHDLRNPLNVIRTNVYLLRQRLASDDPKALRAVERIDDQVTVAMRLLDGVQGFYRADRPSMEQARVNEIARAALDTIPLPEGYQFQADLGDVPPVTADPQLVDTALRALIRNAIEAMTGGGVIRVSVGHGEGRVRLCVEDTGAGIPEADHARVWEPFFTTRRAHAGLGLALVDKIARAHGASRSLECRAGAGTKVCLLLPAG
jgi:two-component system, LuxR family, sensor kinase FixL